MGDTAGATADGDRADTAPVLRLVSDTSAVREFLADPERGGGQAKRFARRATQGRPNAVFDFDDAVQEYLLGALEAAHRMRSEKAVSVGAGVNVAGTSHARRAQMRERPLGRASIRSGQRLAQVGDELADRETHDDRTGPRPRPSGYDVFLATAPHILDASPLEISVSDDDLVTSELNEAVTDLDQSLRDVIEHRFGLGARADHTIRETATALGISEWTVRMRVLEAITALRTALGGSNR